MAAAMRRELLGGTYIQADETPVDVQMHDGRGKNHQAYLWQYSRPGGSVVFDFRLGRGRDGPKQFLGHFEGILQTDGYIAYEKVGGPKRVHVGCWTHARRPFFDALKLHPGDPIATGIVERIDDLFAIDAEARDRPLLDLLKPQIETAGRHALPSSTLGQAVSYALGFWPRLTRFLDYPEVELSNNLTENSMRPVAL